MKSSWNFFDFFWLVFTDPSFMSISSLVLKLWQFLFIRDSPEIRNSEKTPSGFCPVSGDWGEWRTPNLARTSLIKCYWILQNPRVTTLTVSELLRENQKGGKITSHPPRLGLRNIQRTMSMLLDTRFHIWLIMTLYYKMWQILLQNATAILLQNATEVYYKMRQVFYYKMWQFCYKMRQLLQIATVLLQIATVQWVIHKIQIKLIRSSYISLHIQILSSDIYFFMRLNFSYFARIVFFLKMFQYDFWSIALLDRRIYIYSI